MIRMNEVLGVKIMNIWIIRKGGIPLFTKDYDDTFNFGDGVTNPMITAMLDGFLNVFNRGVVGEKCEEMRFGNKIFTFYYPESPINVTTLMISKTSKNNNIITYLLALTEVISKVFVETYKEVLLGITEPLERFMPFEDKLDGVVNDFIKSIKLE